MLKKIDSLEQLNELLAKEEKFFLLKHSLTCPISHAAYVEYQKFSDENQDTPAYYLAIQDARALSNDIAARFQIKHESPQAILFLYGQAHWNTSHWKITNRSLTSANCDSK
jgi:bacillithiol system protein YtxJ